MMEFLMQQTSWALSANHGGNRSLIKCLLRFLRCVEDMKNAILFPTRLLDVELPDEEEFNFLRESCETETPQNLYECYRMLVTFQRELEDGEASDDDDVICPPKMKSAVPEDPQRALSLDSAYASDSSLDRLEAMSDCSDVSASASASRPGKSVGSMKMQLRELTETLHRLSGVCKQMEKTYLKNIIT